MPPGSPDWTLDEEILALDLYVRSGYRVLSGSHPDVIELSNVLNALPIHPHEVRTAKFRNPAGVNTKLANLRWVDPDRPGGLSRCSRLDYEVWERYAEDVARLQDVAEAIRRNYREPEVESVGDNLEDEAPEGRVLLRVHRTRERNQRIVEQRKAWARRAAGKLVCEVCEFDFLAVYGELGNGFIECHHTVPVSSLRPGQKTKVEDLALLCANCHRMIHWSTTPLSVEELKLRFVKGSE